MPIDLPVEPSDEMNDFPGTRWSVLASFAC
eukprot:COSAG02_NODE_18911_length_911_cov_0.761084_1_plen_29_part_10